MGYITGIYRVAIPGDITFGIYYGYISGGYTGGYYLVGICPVSVSRTITAHNYISVIYYVVYSFMDICCVIGVTCNISGQELLPVIVDYYGTSLNTVTGNSSWRN